YSRLIRSGSSLRCPKWSSDRCCSWWPLLPHSRTPECSRTKRDAPRRLLVPPAPPHEPGAHSLRAREHRVPLSLCAIVSSFVPSFPTRAGESGTCVARRLRRERSDASLTSSSTTVLALPREYEDRCVAYVMARVCCRGARVCSLAAIAVDR